MKNKFNTRACYLLISGMFLTCILSCADSPTNPDRTSPQMMMSIYDTIVKLATDTGLVGQITDDYIEIDLFVEPTNRDIDMDDLIISYGTLTSGDEDKWLYNFKNDSWDQISINIGGLVQMVYIRYTKSLSRNGLEFANYISDSNRVKIKGLSHFEEDSYYMTYAYGIKFHSDFQPFEQLNPDLVQTYNLAHDGTDYWMILGNYLTRINDNGEVLFQTSLPRGRSSYLSYSDGRLAYLSHYDTVKVLDSNFDLEYEIVLSRIWSSGLTWGNGKLWVSAQLGIDSTRIYTISLPDSTSGNESIQIDSIDVGYYVTVNAFDGVNLIGAGSICGYIMTTEGVIIDSIPSMNYLIHDMEYQNGILYISGDRPNRINIGSGFIAPFRYDR